MSLSSIKVNEKVTKKFTRNGIITKERNLYVRIYKPEKMNNKIKGIKYVCTAKYKAK